MNKLFSLSFFSFLVGWWKKKLLICQMRTIWVTSKSRILVCTILLLDFPSFVQSENEFQFNFCFHVSVVVVGFIFFLFCLFRARSYLMLNPFFLLTSVPFPSFSSKDILPNCFLFCLCDLSFEFKIWFTVSFLFFLSAEIIKWETRSHKQKQIYSYTIWKSFGCWWLVQTHVTNFELDIAIPKRKVLSDFKSNWFKKGVDQLANGLGERANSFETNFILRKSIAHKTFSVWHQSPK